MDTFAHKKVYGRYLYLPVYDRLFKHHSPRGTVKALGTASCLYLI